MRLERQQARIQHDEAGMKFDGSLTKNERNKLTREGTSMEKNNSGTANASE